MKPYKSIFAEASKPKIVQVKSNSGYVYKVANFPAALGQDFTKFISEKNLDSYVISRNIIACDLYFNVVERKQTIEGTISVVCGATEFVRYISDEITLEWMVKTGTEYVGTSQDDSGRMQDVYRFKPEKGLKFFKDNFFKRGYIIVGDYFKPEAYSLGESKYSINNYLQQPITSAQPDVDEAKAAITASKTPQKTKPKKVSKAEKEKEEAVEFLEKNYSKFSSPDESVEDEDWEIYHWSPVSWNTLTGDGRHKIPTIQKLVAIGESPKYSSRIKKLLAEVIRKAKLPLVWSSTEFKNYAVVYNPINNKIEIIKKDAKLPLVCIYKEDYV